MASITLTGALLDPTGEVAVGDQIRFTHQTTTGETIQFARSVLIIPPNGLYNITLEFGLILVEYLDIKDVNYKTLGVVTVNGDTTATDLPGLLNAIVPPTDAQLLLFQGILADTEDARDIALLAAAQQTTLELIASTTTHPAGTVLTLSGHTLSGDGGGGRWKLNGVVGQTPSQSPTDLADFLLNDGNGNQWALVFGQVLAFNGVQYLPLPFGASGNGSYSYNDNEFSKISDLDRLNPATLEDWQNDTSAQAGDVVTVAEYNVGGGVEATGQVISGILTANGSDKVQHGTLSLTWVLRKTSTRFDNQYGNVPNSSTDLTSLQATFDDASVSQAANFDLKGKTVIVDPGNRIAVSSFQVNLTGIIQFADLDWPLNSVVKFPAGAREQVWHINNIADDGTPVNEFRIHSPYHPGIVLNQLTSISYGDFVQDAHSVGGTHDGANNVAVLTDTSMALTINELIGKTIENITDGSKAAITSNTATTITGVLSGGTDNDWDIGDTFITYGDSERFCSIVFQSDAVGQFQFFNDSALGELQVKTFPKSGGFNSKVWRIDRETGDQTIQAANIDTTDGAALVVGGSLKIRNGTGAINGHESETEPRLIFHNGNDNERAFIGLDTLTDAINVKGITKTAEGDNVFKIAENTFFQNATFSGVPSTAAAMRIGHNSGTNRSISCGGDITVNGTSAIFTSGTGSPEGVVAAVVGSIFTRIDGGANTTLYVKESGSGNTGWVAK